MAAAAFSPDGGAIATGDQTGTIRLWELPGCRPRWRAPLMTLRPARLYSHHGVDARRPTGAEEGDDTVHGAVVGESQSRLAQASGAAHQPLDQAQAVEQRVLGMDMQMDKVVGHGNHRWEQQYCDDRGGKMHPGRIGSFLSSEPTPDGERIIARQATLRQLPWQLFARLGEF